MIEATESALATCQYSGCTNSIKQTGGRGHRERLFCSDRCRQRHHREEEERKRWEAMAAIEAEASTRIEALERQVEELQERLNIEERFRTDTRKRDFKAWLRSHPRPQDTTFFRRFLDDRELPASASRSLYRARLRQHGYAIEDILLFEEAWKDMLFQS
jgi:hypothetical protein